MSEDAHDSNNLEETQPQNVVESPSGKNPEAPAGPPPEAPPEAPAGPPPEAPIRPKPNPDEADEAAEQQAEQQRLMEERKAAAEDRKVRIDKALGVLALGGLPASKDTTLRNWYKVTNEKEDAVLKILELTVTNNKGNLLGALEVLELALNTLVHRIAIRGDVCGPGDLLQTLGDDHSTRLGIITDQLVHALQTVREQSDQILTKLRDTGVARASADRAVESLKRENAALKARLTPPPETQSTASAAATAADVAPGTKAKEDV